MTTLERLARWSASLSFGDIPPRIVEKARWQQASVLAASFAGLRDPAAQKVAAWARADGGAGSTPVLAGGFACARPAAVFANASLSCTFDYDDILLLGHTGHSAVTVPLALGAELGSRFDEVLTAQVAANEVAARFGLTSFLSPQNGQMIPYLHCVSAAIAAGRLLGLDEGQMAHALAIALAQPPAALWPSFLGSLDVKVLIAAHGTAMGVRAAELAALGLTGALDLLDHPRGFFHRFTFVALPRCFTGLGRAWLSDTLQAKLHAACAYFEAMLEALREGLQGERLDASRVRRLVCRVTFLGEAVDATERQRPRGPLCANEVNFSIPMAAAVLLSRGRLVPSALDARSLSEGETALRELAAKVEVVHDRRLSRALLGGVDQAVDVAGLLGSASVSELARGVRRLRAEFPHANALGAGELLAFARRAPELMARFARARRREYDLGTHDLAGAFIPLAGGYALTLDDGRVLEGEREVGAGALGLPGAPGRVAEKLEEAAAHVLRAEGAVLLRDALRDARPETPVAEIVAEAAGGPPNGGYAKGRKTSYMIPRAPRRGALRNEH